MATLIANLVEILGSLLMVARIMWDRQFYHTCTRSVSVPGCITFGHVLKLFFSTSQLQLGLQGCYPGMVYLATTGCVVLPRLKHSRGCSLYSGLGSPGGRQCRYST